MFRIWIGCCGFNLILYEKVMSPQVIGVSVRQHWCSGSVGGDKTVAHIRTPKASSTWRVAVSRIVFVPEGNALL